MHFWSPAELLTNAIKATPNKPIELVCRWGLDAITIEIWDSSHAPPVPVRQPDLTLDTLDLSEGTFDTYGGHGLRIVEAIAADWGHRPVDGDPPTGRMAGKWVWARLRV